MIAFVYALHQQTIKPAKKPASNNPLRHQPEHKKEFLQTHTRESAHFLFVFHYSMQNILPVRPVYLYI